MNEPIDKTRRNLLIAGAVSPALALSSLPQTAMAGVGSWSTLAIDKAAKAIHISDMFGVCVTTVSGGHDNFTRWGEVAKALNELGVTWVRTSMVNSNTTRQVDYLETLIAKCDELKFQCIIGKGNTSEAQIKNYLTLIRNNRLLKANVVRVEGANEWNLSDKEKKPNPNWAAQLVDHQRHLHANAKQILGDDTQVVGFSIGNPTSLKGRQAYDKLYNANGRDKFTDVMDLGNVHLYIGGQRPEKRRDLEEVWEKSRFLYGNPLMYTETGFHNYEDSSTHKYTPPIVAGEYTPRLILDYFSRDIKKLSMYELVDDGKQRTGKKAHEPHFGLYRADASGFHPKPAGLAFRQLNQLALSTWLGAGKSATAADWESRIQIQKDTAVKEVKTVLLRGDGGRALLCLWRSDTDRFINSRTPNTVDEKPINLRFPINMHFKVHCFGEKPQTFPNRKTLLLEVGAKVKYIELEPAGAG